MHRHAMSASILALVTLATACGSEGKASPSNAAALSTPGVETPAPGGRIHTVDMVTDGEGNIFGPEELTVRSGDVVRFVLKTGVHNVNFVADSNPGAATLPTATPYLQIPGQTYDIKIDLPPGRYYYHCDPHALLGMIGYLVVEP